MKTSGNNYFPKLLGTSKPKLRLAMSIVKGSVVLGSLGVGTIWAYSLTDAKFKKKIDRQSYFWSKMLPIYCHYKAVEWYLKINFVTDPSEQLEYYEPLHEKYATRTLDVIHNLRGLYIKMGQVASCRADVLPPQYYKEMVTLQDNVPATKWDTVKTIIERELEQPIEEVFLSIDENPIGAASIGQVHNAILLDGTEVVVKVMYPDVEEMFKVDMLTIKIFCRISLPQYLPLLDEIEKQLMTEFDYRVEANNLRKVSENITPLWGQKVIFPQPIRTAKHILIMTKIPGMTLLEAVRANRSLKDTSTETSTSFINNQIFHYFLQLFGVSVNSLFSSQSQQKPLIDQAITYYYQSLFYLSSVAITVYNFTAYCINNTLSLLSTTSSIFDNKSTEDNNKKNMTTSETDQGYFLNYINLTSPLDVAQDLLRTLFQVHGHQIFLDGVFNGDPHPGNILLTPDRRLGLLDYGQVKVLTLQERLQLAKLIVALEKGTKEEVVQAYTAMGFRTKYMNPDVIYFHAYFSYAIDDTNILLISSGNYKKKMQKIDPVVDVPDNFVMAARVAMLLRGMGYAIKYRARASEEWLPFALTLLREHGMITEEEEIRYRHKDSVGFQLNTSLVATPRKKNIFLQRQKSRNNQQSEVARVEEIEEQSILLCPVTPRAG